VSEATTTPTRVEGYICVTRDQRWGWGTTPDGAIKAARKAGSRDSAKGNRAILALPTGALDAYVDMMGSVRWDWAPDSDRSQSGHWVESAK
jgi:hypothetical protein